MKTITEPEKKIPVVAETDVIVIGGGPGGIGAALAAGRNGAETILVERFGYLGGMMTAGLMTSFNGFRNERPPDQLQAIKGIPAEIIWKLKEMGAATGRTAHGDFSNDLQKGRMPYAVGYDPEAMKYLLLKLTQEAGVSLLLHTYFAEAIVEGNALKGVIVENKSGRQALLAKVVIDATGDGDVAARAGAPFEPVLEPSEGTVKVEGERMMGMTLMYRVGGVEPEKLESDRGFIVHGKTSVLWGAGVRADGVDASDLTRAEIQAREQTFEKMNDLRQRPGFENCYLVHTADMIGVRETRRILGEYVLSEQDAISGARFDDVVSISCNPVPNYYGKRFFFDHEGFDIPYRALVPREIDGLLLSGRCISAHQVAFQSLRAIPACMAIGQAAGVAAAVAAKGMVRPRDVNVQEVQRLLLEQAAELRV